MSVCLLEKQIVQWDHTDQFKNVASSPYPGLLFLLILLSSNKCKEMQCLVEMNQKYIFLKQTFLTAKEIIGLYMWLLLYLLLYTYIFYELKLI